MAHGLTRAGAKVAIMGRRQVLAAKVAAHIESEGGEALALPADVLEIDQLRTARETLLARWGRVDVLVNAAGGNMPAAIVQADSAFFDMPQEPLDQIFALNLTGSILPSQIFGAPMAEQREGCIVNISSMAASRAMTRVVAYSAAKAAIDNFTRWLAVEVAHKYGEKMRVNAIAPGFFLGEFNRPLLMNDDETLTPRGQAIVNGTPVRRFGDPNELISALLWLCGPGASFVTGTVIAIDGGFSAYSGV